MPAEQVSPIEAVMLRNSFYKDNYRLVTTALLSSCVVLSLLLGIIFYLITHPLEPRYFATTDDGKILQIVPVTQPNLTESELLQWAKTAAIAAYSYSYANWREQLQGCSEFFTPEGWRDFINALQASNNLAAVRDKKLMVSADTTGPAVLVKAGLFNNRYTWKVQIPLLITYQNADRATQQAVLVTMLIVRLPTLTSLRGVAVAQLIASEQ